MSGTEQRLPEPPGDPGARLAAQRESLGLSVQQAAERLNLEASAVMALERNDFGALGVPVFARGHLRRYAASLGLPVDELLESYDHSRSQPGQPTLIPKARLDMSPVRARPRWPLLIGSVLLFLVAAAVAAYISNYGLRLPGGAPVGSGPAEAQAGSEFQASQATLDPEPTPAQPSGSSPQFATTEPAAAPDGGTPPPAAPRPGEVTLRLNFAADCWVEIYDGTGKAVVYDLGQRGTQRAFAAVAPLSVTLGNAPAVKLQVNGRDVATPVPPAGQTVARFGVAPDGSLR